MVKMLTVLLSTISSSKATHIFSANVFNSVYAIFNVQSFNSTLTNDVVSFEQLGAVRYRQYVIC